MWYYLHPVPPRRWDSHPTYAVGQDGNLSEKKMSKICYICGKKPAAGGTIKRRGLAKKKGGVGQRITGRSRRRFLPNLQPVRAIIDGKTKKIRVCTKCLKAGKVTKA